MKLNKLIVLLVCVFATSSLFAQTVPCGLHDHDLLIDRLVENKKYLKEIGIQQKDGVVSYIPVKYHIIAQNDGSNGASAKRVLEMHCVLNDFFSEGDDGLQFYIKDGFNYINNNTVYNDHISNTGQIIMAQNRDAQALNIFLPNDANTNSNSVGTTLGYYSPSDDWIVMRKAEANAISTTVVHEVGHYLSLPHPFNGWDFEPYNASVHGVSVGTWSPAGVPNERVDGSNCNTAGDRICDTPANYLFFPWQGCDYNGGAQDPNGQLLDPDEFNMMDYYSDDCAPKHFTDQQKQLMLVDYENRGELHAPWNPLSTNITGPPAIVEPQEGSISAGFDQVFFDWEPVNGADRYLLEVDRLSSFNLDPTVMVVFTSSATVSGVFEADKTYRWRVTPFNPYYTCAESSPIIQFTTGTVLSANNVLEVDNLTIEPNPVSQNYVVVSLDTDTAFDSQISILSATGQTLQLTTRHFQVGHSDIELSIQNIPNGIYFVNIASEDKLITKKLVVSK